MSLNSPLNAFRDNSLWLHGLHGLTFAGDLYEHIQIFKESIDIESASCFSAEDQSMIINGIIDRHGNNKRFDMKLRFQLVTVMATQAIKHNHALFPEGFPLRFLPKMVSAYRLIKIYGLNFIPILMSLPSY